MFISVWITNTVKIFTFLSLLVFYFERWSLPFKPARFVMSMVSRISMAFLESTDNSSSPSGQGISTIVDSNRGVLVIEKKLSELHILDGFVVEGWKRRANPPLFRIFWKTSWGVSSLNGGTPVRNSKRHTPSAHQSTMKSARVDDDNNNNKRRRNSHILYSHGSQTPHFSL